MSILRQWFGPSKTEIWQQLCAETGARFVDGGFWHGDKVQAKYAEWVITLDTYVAGKHTYTRMRAPYVNPGHFRFTIFRDGVFSGVAKWFGMQDINVGYGEFDHEFVIKGNDEGKLRALFRNPRLRTLISIQPKIHFAVKDNEGFFGAHFPPGTDELCFEVYGVIKDRERLRSLFEMFAVTLDQLCSIGEAYEDGPGVDL